jgi:hypothetical protein
VNRSVSITIILLLLLVIVILLWFFQQGRNNILTDPYKAVPTDACFVVESVDLPSLLNNLTEESTIFKELSNFKELNRFTLKLSFIAGLINRKEYQKIFEKNTSLISFHFSDKGELIPLLSMNVPPEIRFRHITGLLASTLPDSIAQRRTLSGKTVEIYYPSGKSIDTLFVTFDSGLLFFSQSEELIKRAIRQKRTNSDIRSLPGFSKIQAASGKRIDKIFIVFSNISRLVGSAFSGKGKGLEALVSKLASCAEGDIYLSNGGILLSGYTECSDSSQALYRYKFIPSGKPDTYKILPSTTYLFETIILPEVSEDRASDGQPSDSALLLSSGLKLCLGEEITRALINVKGNSESDNRLIIYELKKREAAELLLTKWIDSQRASVSKEEKQSITWFQPDEQTRIPVYSSPGRGLTTILAPGFAGSEPDSLFAFYDNFLITGNSYSAVTRLLYDNILNNTLANDLTWRDFEGTMPSRAGYFFYCIPSGIINWLSNYLNDTIISVLNSNLVSLKKIQAAGFQLSASNGMIYNTLSIKYKEELREESGAEWETLLDTSACIKPFFFTNHNSGTKEIFIQDYRNNAYLINAAGRILWKVQLAERILGNVYMIDYYGNGKFQLLFSGKNNLHLLDRNGNYVERYPVKLRSPASGPPALFDYDGNHEYRILIPGADRYIYAYDKSGNVVKGWQPFRTTGTVTSEVKYFRVSGKDFLVASDETSVYFLDRTGNIRIKPKEPVARGKGSEIRIINGSEPALVFSSPDGTLQKVSFDGTVRKTVLKKFTVDHTFDFFDVDGDGYGEYIFIDRGIMYLYDHDKSEVFNHDFSSAMLDGPLSFIFSAEERKIGVFDNTKRLIYLIDKRGNIMNGFPLRGASMFSIGKFSDKDYFHLIVGGDNSYLYNYKLNTAGN